VPIAKTQPAQAVEATVENAYKGQYPLSRFLLLYVNKKPGEALDPLRREFLKFVLSRQGQETVLKDGYYPLTPPLVEQAKKSAGLD
jgi:phosphate transport system substrate-binding protein